jgi:hypothetical protein
MEANAVGFRLRLLGTLEITDSKHSLRTARWALINSVKKQGARAGSNVMADVENKK